MTWINRLKTIMQERGLKQKDLAEMLGVSQSSVTTMLQNDTRISSIERIAHVLGIPVSDLFTQGQRQAYDEEYRETHVHGYIRIGRKIVEVNSIKELKDAVTACEVNYLK